MFFALFPFSFVDTAWTDSTAWTLLGAALTVYVIIGMYYLLAGSIRLRAIYPDLFPLPLIVFQAVLHGATLIIGIVILLGLNQQNASLYTLALIILLMHGSVAFVRTLFYRRQ